MLYLSPFFTGKVCFKIQRASPFLGSGFGFPSFSRRANDVDRVVIYRFVVSGSYSTDCSTVMYNAVISFVAGETLLIVILVVLVTFVLINSIGFFLTISYLDDHSWFLDVLIDLLFRIYKLVHALTFVIK